MVIYFRVNSRTEHKIFGSVVLFVQYDDPDRINPNAVNEMKVP